MSLGTNTVVGVVGVGIGASLIMDLWNLFLKRVFGIPSLNYCLLGRWLRHLPTGTFRHASIAAAAPRSRECAIGWIAHYTIGAAFAFGLVVLASPDWLARPTLLPALLYGLGTVVFPFFVMQPSFGLGIAAARSPRPAQARLKSLVTHAVFGCGLYLSALCLSYASTWLPGEQRPDPWARWDAARQANVPQPFAADDALPSCARLSRMNAGRSSG